MTILLQGDMVETEACRPLKRLFKQLPVVTDNVQMQFSHWIYWLSPNWGVLVIILQGLLRFLTGSRDSNLKFICKKKKKMLQIRCNRQTKVSAREKEGIPRYRQRCSQIFHNNARTVFEFGPSHSAGFWFLHLDKKKKNKPSPDLN